MLRFEQQSRTTTSTLIFRPSRASTWSIASRSRRRRLRTAWRMPWTCLSHGWFAAPELQVLISGADAAQPADLCASLQGMKTAVPIVDDPALLGRLQETLSVRSARLLKFDHGLRARDASSMVTAALEPPFTIRKIPDADKLPKAVDVLQRL